MKISLFTSLPPVSKTGLDWGSPRAEVGCPWQNSRGLSEIGCSEEVSSGLVAKKTVRDAIQGTKVLCPDNAEEVEKILRGIRRTRAAAVNSGRLAFIRAFKGCRYSKTFTNNRRRYFVLGVQEREVVRGVVSELEEFGGFKGRKTAEQQSDQRDEDELGSHFKARSQGPLIQHPCSQLNGTLDLFAPVRFSTNSQYLRHLADDVLPGILERVLK